MAVTANLVSGGQKAKRWVITWTLDGDTSITIDHGFNGAPDHINILPLNPQAYTGRVFRGAVTNTQLTITKTTDAGSAGAEVEVIAFIPHSTL